MTWPERQLRREADRASATPMRGRRSPSSRTRVDEIYRARILLAMVEVVSEHGRQSTTVARVVDRAGVGRRTFYDLFDDCSGCVRAVFEDGVARAAARMRAAYDPLARWADRVRAALCALLELVDEEPKLARVCFEHALGSPAAMNGRRETFDQLTKVIDEGRTATRAARDPPRLVAHVVVGGSLTLVYGRLITREFPVAARAGEPIDVDHCAALPGHWRGRAGAEAPHADAVAAGRLGPHGRTTGCPISICA